MALSLLLIVGFVPQTIQLEALLPALQWRQWWWLASWHCNTTWQPLHLLSPSTHQLQVHVPISQQLCTKDKSPAAVPQVLPNVSNYPQYMTATTPMGCPLVPSMQKTDGDSSGSGGCSGVQVPHQHMQQHSANKANGEIAPQQQAQNEGSMQPPSSSCWVVT